MAIASIIESIAQIAERLGLPRGDYALYCGDRLVCSSRSLSQMVWQMVHLSGILDGEMHLSHISKTGEVEIWRQ